MKFLKNTIGFLAIFAALPAFAVTARPSVTGAAMSSRLPTIAAGRYNSTTSYVATSANLLDNSDCISAYTSCIKGADACGDDMSECTNRVLFHGKMAGCLGVLAQCNSNGIQALFGTTSMSALGQISSCKKYNTITTGGTNTCKEVGDYTYPTAGSVLGQMIDGAYISTRLDTSKCVQRYTTCLKGATVCGADFGLCTSETEFNKQKVFCESTLARCESAGIRELFGNDTGDTLGDGRIKKMITDASELAALNAVQNCYNVVDNCVQTACKRNPYKCKSGVSVGLVDLTEQVALRRENPSSTINMNAVYGTTVESNVVEYIRNQCFDVITANKSCFLTFNEGNKASNKDMADTFNQELVFSEAYNTRMSAANMQTKINGYIEDFDKEQKDACVDLIGQCAIGACGGGSNAVCYDNIFGDTGKANGATSINHSSLYDDIKSTCEAVINTAPECIYAAANIGSNGIGNYNSSYVDGEAFTTLFPQYKSGGDDPLGVIANINATLASAFTPTMITESQKQCQTAAYDCIKKMCGTDYVNCYRNRTDVMSTLTNTNNTAFNNSMNKVGGVLDYTVVLGLCVNSVKDEEKCATYLDIETARKAKTKKQSSSWLDSTKYGTSTLRNDWLSAGNATNLTETNIGRVQDEDEYGNLLCCTKNSNECGVCGGYNANNEKYSEPKMVADTVYAQKQAATGIFQDVIYDAEKEAQAIYNAKLTAEQNACLAMNRGGIVGNNNAGSTYAWVKLRNGRVPASYANDGLAANSFVASNELYNSFCRVRVMVTSNDKAIQDYMRGQDWATAYFAVGDPFVCGSWIPGDDLTNIANLVAADKTGTDERGSLKVGQQWATAGISLLGGGLAAGITDMLQTKTGLGGLLGSTSNVGKKNQTASDSCVRDVDSELNYWNVFVANNSNKVTDEDADSKYNGCELSYSSSIYGINNKTVARMTYDCSAAKSGSSILKSVVDNHIKELESARRDVCGTGDSAGMRAGMDVLGAALGTGIAGITSWQAFRAANRAKFTEAQQEFMDNVGSKINCVIGNDGYDLSTLGSFGDMMISELDTAQ